MVVGLAFARGEGSLGALVIAHVFFNLAVVVRVVGTAWSDVDPDLEDAAEILGAHGWRRFAAVLWPAGRAAIAGAATLVFLFSLTSFGAALLLAPPGEATIEVEIWRRTSQFLDLPVAAALALVQLAVRRRPAGAGRRDRVPGGPTPLARGDATADADHRRAAVPCARSSPSCSCSRSGRCCG